jgi:hypothetical protein
MKWITNTGKEQAPDTIRELCLGHLCRDIRKGVPKQTKKYSTGELQAMGMIGLYDAGESS